MGLRVLPIAQRITAFDVIHALYHYRVRFFVTFAVVLLPILGYALFCPAGYRSEMKMLLHVPAGEARYSSNRLFSAFSSGTDGDPIFNSEVQVLRSADVADRAVDATWSTSSRAGHGAKELKAHEAAVARLQAGLSVDRPGNANVLRVAYEAPTANEAADTLDRFLIAFLAKQRSLQNADSRTAFLRAEVERYQSQLQDARQQQGALAEDHRFLSAHDAEASLEQQIETQQQQVRSTDLQISDAAVRLASSQKELQTLPQRQLTQKKTVPNSLITQQLTTLLVTYRNEKTRLLTKYLPTDRLVQEVDQQIADTTEALRTASEAPSEDSTDVNPVWQQVRSAVAQSTIERNAAQARKRDLEMQIAGLQAVLARTEGTSSVVDAAALKVADLQGKYQVFSQKLAEAESAVDSGARGLADVSVIQSPTLPSSPAGVSRIQLSLFGALSALACAAGVVLIPAFCRRLPTMPGRQEAMLVGPGVARLAFFETQDARLQYARLLTSGNLAEASEANGSTPTQGSVKQSRSWSGSESVSVSFVTQL